MRFMRKVANYAALVIPVLLALAFASAQAQQPSAAQTDAIRQSCRSDFMADCKGVQPGGADALHCLQRNAAALSPPCKAAVAATMSRRRPPHIRRTRRRSGGATATRRDATCAGGRAAQSATVHNAAKTRGDFGDLRRRRTEVVCRRAARWPPHPRVPGGTCGWSVTGMLRRDRPRQREIAPGRWAYPGPAI
jgi:hypothetical protein